MGVSLKFPYLLTSMEIGIIGNFFGQNFNNFVAIKSEPLKEYCSHNSIFYLIVTLNN